MPTGMRLRHNRLPELARAFAPAVSAILRRGAFATEAGGKVRSPVATGYLRSSHQTEGAEPGSLSMRVIVTADYAAFVHEPTIRTPGRPWLRETTEQTFPQVIKELRQLEKAL